MTLEKEEALVQLARKGERLQVNVSERGSGKQTVQLNVPVPVIDALLAGNAEHFDIHGAVEALKTAPRGDLVTVNDADSQVRVWID